MLNDKPQVKPLSGIEEILSTMSFAEGKEKEDKEDKAGEKYEGKYKDTGKKSKDYDGDGTVEDEADEYAGVKDKAIKDAKDEEEDKNEKEGKKEKKESVDFSSVLDELTDEDILFLSDDLIEEVVEEFFYETLDEGFDVDELETLLIEQVDSELTYLEEAKVTTGHDTEVEPEASRTSKLAKIKDAVKKVASGAKSVAKKVAHGAGEVAGAAVAGYKKASASAPASGGASGGGSKSTSGSSSSGSSATGTKRPGILGRVGSALKSGLKRAIHGAGKAVGKVVKTAKAGYDEGRGKSAPAPAAKPAAPAAKPAAKKPTTKTATTKKKSGGNLDNLLNQIRNEEVELDEKIDVGANVGRTISDFVRSSAKTFKGDTKKQRINRALGAYYGAQKEEVELEEEGKVKGADGKACWKGYKYAGTENGKDKCVPMEEYIDLYLDMIEEGYTIDQVREVLAAYEDGFEVIFEEDGVTINDNQEVLEEEFLSDVEMVADWLYAEGVIESEDQFFELMEDLSEEEIQELYDVVMEAEGSYGQTPKARAAMGRVAIARRERPASEYSQKGEKTRKVREIEKHTRRIDNGPDAGDHSKKSTKPRHSGFAGKSGRGKLDQDSRDYARDSAVEYTSGGHKPGSGTVTKNPKKLRKQKAMGEIGEENYMIGNSLEDGGLEVRNYSWSELLEDLSEEEIQELYDVVEATAMAKRGYDETKLRQRAGGGEAADRATALEKKSTFGDANKAKQRQNYARAQRGDFRKTASSNPGLHVGQHKSDDPKVKAKQAARGAQRGALTPKERKELNMGYEMIGNSLEEGGLEVRNYSWREVMEAQVARNNPEKYEAEQKKKTSKSAMPPRGDKRREDFEKWYAANVR